MDSNRIITADLNEMLFEGRNKSYGAYTMRTQSHLFLMRAALTGLLLFVLATATPLFICWFSASAIAPVKETPVEDWSWVQMTMPPDQPLPPSPPAPKAAAAAAVLPPVSTTRFVVPVPAPDVKNEEILIANDSLTSDPGLKNLKGTGAPWNEGREDSVRTIVNDLLPANTERPDPKAFIPGVESEPREVNMDDLRKEIGYPAKAKEARIQGIVTFRVLIDELGAYREHINISRPGTHALLVNAVEEHLKELRCTPGIQNGKPIPMWVNVSFSFKLH